MLTVILTYRIVQQTMVNKCWHSPP